MSPRITYWTGTWDPDKEAISKEITALRAGDRDRAPVVSFAPGQRTEWSWRERVFRLSERRWVLLRMLGAIFEPLGDITHVFGGPSSWHLLRSLGRRPLLLTAVIGASLEGLELPGKRFARVVVEAEDSIDEWVSRGVPRERIELIRPGIDLTRFVPAPEPPGGRFTLMFASTPASVDELSARGIPALVELARMRPDIDILVPWRQWGDLDASQRALAALGPPPNFVVTHEAGLDIRQCYHRSHATIACVSPGKGKTVLNFVVEGLGCGLPAITLASSALADQLTRSGAGVVAESSDPSVLSGAVDRIAADWVTYSVRARRLAEVAFDATQFRSAYERLYREISSNARS